MYIVELTAVPKLRVRILFVLSALSALAGLMEACGTNHAECVGGTSAASLSVCTKGPSVKGVDVSVYQGTVDWSAVKGAGTAYAFIRVSDGATTLDAQFAKNWPAAKSAGVLRGAYQFFRASEDPTKQANVLLSSLQAAGGLEKGDLPVVIDLETADGQSNATVVSRALAWLTLVEERTGARPFVYTGPSMSSVIGTSFSKYALWVANYEVTCPTMPSGFSDWVFWQSSSKGAVAGIKGAVDLDTFNGDATALAKLTLTATPGGGDASVYDAGPLPPPSDDAGGAAMAGNDPTPAPTVTTDAAPSDPCASP